MMKKWITPGLIIIGAILLFGASGLDNGDTNSYTLWFKVVGLLCIILGIFRATKAVRSHGDKAGEDDTER